MIREKFLEHRLKSEKIENAFSVTFFPKSEIISFGQGNQNFFNNFLIISEKTLTLAEEPPTKPSFR